MLKNNTIDQESTSLALESPLITIHRLKLWLHWTIAVFPKLITSEMITNYKKNNNSNLISRILLNVNRRSFDCNARYANCRIRLENCRERFCNCKDNDLRKNYRSVLDFFDRILLLFSYAVDNTLLITLIIKVKCVNLFCKIVIFLDDVLDVKSELSGRPFYFAAEEIKVLTSSSSLMSCVSNFVLLIKTNDI